MKAPKSIVVDASVARSAGLTENPTSLRCREVMQTMLVYCHRVVLISDLDQEWRRHASLFARSWLSTMAAKKKLLVVENSGDYGELYRRVEACLETPIQQQAVYKDFHLVIAALESDKIVITLDKKLFALLDVAAGQVEELRSLIFANRDAAEEQIVAWLNRGAPAENKRCLGYKPRRRG